MHCLQQAHALLACKQQDLRRPYGAGYFVSTEGQIPRL